MEGTGAWPRLVPLFPSRPPAGFPGFSCPGRDRRTGEPTAHTPGGDGRGLLGSGTAGPPAGPGHFLQGEVLGVLGRPSVRALGPLAAARILGCIRAKGNITWGPAFVAEAAQRACRPQAWGSPWATVSGLAGHAHVGTHTRVSGPRARGRLPVCTGQSSVRASRPAARCSRSEPVRCLGLTLPLPPLHASGPLPGPACLEKPDPGHLLGTRSGSAHRDTGFSAQLSLTGGRLPSDRAVPSAVPSARPVSAGVRPPSTARLTCLLLAVCGPRSRVQPHGCSARAHPACRCPHAPSALGKACVLRECVNEWTAPAHLSVCDPAAPLPGAGFTGLGFKDEGLQRTACRAGGIPGQGGAAGAGLRTHLGNTDSKHSSARRAGVSALCYKPVLSQSALVLLSLKVRHVHGQTRG